MALPTATEDAAVTTFASLPPVLARRIFALVPVDSRLRCAEVSPAWRDALAERALWTRLDLLPVQTQSERDDALDELLRCAAARAGGGLEFLCVDARYISERALTGVLIANAGALRELHTHDGHRHQSGSPFGLFTHEVQDLLHAAPQLHTLCADIIVGVAGYYGMAITRTDLRALQNEAPFGPLRVRRLTARLQEMGMASIKALAAVAASHPSLEELVLDHAYLGFPEVLDAVVDAALKLKLRTVELRTCELPQNAAHAEPSLARLLSGGALTTLRCNYDPGFTMPASAAMLADAFRTSATLTTLELKGSCVFHSYGWHDPADAGAALLGSLTGHATLRELDIRYSVLQPNDTAVAACAALGALVAANAPALTSLNVSWCVLRDAGMRPLFEALPANTHLRVLSCMDTSLSNAFVAEELLPAVQANSGLCKLELATDKEPLSADPCLKAEAEAVMRMVQDRPLA